jgi:hypothetical protein
MTFSRLAMSGGLAVLGLFAGAAAGLLPTACGGAESEPADELRYDLGHIALQTAPAPEGPWSEAAVAIGWAFSSPFSSEGAGLLLGDVPSWPTA